MYLGLRHTVYYQLCIANSVYSFLILTIKHLSRGLHYTMINTWLIAKVFYFHINFNFDEYNNYFFPIAEQLHAMIIVRYIWNLNYAFWLQFIVSSNSIWKIESQNGENTEFCTRKCFPRRTCRYICDLCMCCYAFGLLFPADMIGICIKIKNNFSIFFNKLIL